MITLESVMINFSAIFPNPTISLCQAFRIGSVLNLDYNDSGEFEIRSLILAPLESVILTVLLRSLLAA
jgi:hypothetical protein